MIFGAWLERQLIAVVHTSELEFVDYYGDVPLSGEALFVIAPHLRQDDRMRPVNPLAWHLLLLLPLHGLHPSPQSLVLQHNHQHQTRHPMHLLHHFVSNSGPVRQQCNHARPASSISN